MDILLFNMQWMIYNVVLAIIPVVLGFLMLKFRSKKLKITIGLVWFAFLPNTIYMLTDINHLLEQWNQVSNSYKPLLVFQYVSLMIFAVITFISAQYPFEKILKRDFKLGSIPRTIILIIVDFLVAFGVILGGIERVNSWQIVTDPKSVLQNISILFHSQAQVGLVIGFGGLFSVIYFSFHDRLIQISKRIKKTQ